MYKSEEGREKERRKEDERRRRKKWKMEKVIGGEHGGRKIW